MRLTSDNDDENSKAAPAPNRGSDEKASSFVMAHAGLPDGRFVGPYQVRALLGSGAFGVVYLAKDTRNDQNVALKLPRLEVLMNDEKRKRFEIEGSIGSELQHPGIVGVLESGNAGSLPYIATDWCDGSDLGQWLANCEMGHQAMPSWQQAARLIAEIADAIHYAHQQGVAHRDLKPANILLEGRKTDDPTDGENSAQIDGDGLGQFRARVSDFGLAKLFESTMPDTRSSLMVGTPVYMSPERIAAQTETSEKSSSIQSGISADIYSLGAILMELLTGEPPLSGSNYLEVVGEAVNRSNAAPGRVPKGVPQQLPNGLSEIVSTCLRSHPNFRYHSAAELAEDLRRSLAGEPIKGKPIGMGARSRCWLGNKNWYAIAGWFAIGSQTLSTVWLVLSDLFKIRFGLLTVEGYLEIFPQLLMIAITTSLTTIIVGLFCVKGYKWAAWLGGGLALANLTPAAISLFGSPSFFGDIYRSTTPYFTFQIHLVIALIFLSQLVFYLLAIARPFFRLKR